MSYEKEIGKILAEAINEMVLSEEKSVQAAAKKHGYKTHEKTEDLVTMHHPSGSQIAYYPKTNKTTFHHQSGSSQNWKSDDVDALLTRHHKKMQEEFEEDKQLQEIRAIERLRMALNKDMLSSDPVAKQRAMRLQALQRRKLEVTHGIGMDEAEGTLKDAKDHSDAERHPWHAEATKAGLTHKSTYTKGSKSYHIYHPDHHWKNGAKLVTTKRKGSADKHSWEGSAFGDKGNDLKSLHSHLNAGVNNYDSLMAHHKKGTGPFDPKKQ